MADAEDLKSSGDFSSCGFDSHPGHQSSSLKLNRLFDHHCACTPIRCFSDRDCGGWSVREWPGNLRNVLVGQQQQRYSPLLYVFNAGTL